MSFYNTIKANFQAESIITIYAPLIYTALCVMFLTRADTLWGQMGGGWALEIESFWAL
jgi:hypothetical protein